VEFRELFWDFGAPGVSGAVGHTHRPSVDMLLVVATALAWSLTFLLCIWADGLSAGQGHFQEPARSAFRSNLRTENRGTKAQVKTEVKMEQPWPFATLFWAFVVFFTGRTFCVNHIRFGFHLVFT